MQGSESVNGSKDAPTRGADWREVRRLEGWMLHQQGWTQQQIAESLGVTQAAVSQWVRRVQEGGVESLRRRKAPGARPRLTEEQRRHLLKMLEKSPEAYGFDGDEWTCGRIAELIYRQWKVSYHHSHISRLLASIKSSEKSAKKIPA